MKDLTKGIVDLERVHCTSVQGPRTQVELVKDSTKGRVDLKRVHCTSIQGPRTQVELVKDLTKGIVDLIESPPYTHSKSGVVICELI